MHKTLAFYSATEFSMGDKAPREWSQQSSSIALFFSLSLQIQTNTIVADIDGLVVNLTGDDFRGRIENVST